MAKRRQRRGTVQVYSAAAIEKLKSLSITNIYSPLVFNNLKHLTVASVGTTAAIKEIESFIAADLFLPDQRTAGNLNTPYGAEILVDGEFVVHTGGVLDNWIRVGMTEDSYSTVAPYSGISHAVVVDDNAGVAEGIFQNVSLDTTKPYKLIVYGRSDSGTKSCRITQANLSDALYDDGIAHNDTNVSTSYSLKTKHFKTATDTLGAVYLWGTVGGTTINYYDLASLRRIFPDPGFPNYVLGTADGATGDRYGSSIVALSDGGIAIYKGPLAGAAGTNDITYTRTHTTVIGQVYTVVYTAYSDGTGTGQVLFGTEISAIAATTTTPTTVSFTFTATGVSTDLVIKSRTANGKITIKGVSVR